MKIIKYCLIFIFIVSSLYAKQQKLINLTNTVTIKKEIKKIEKKKKLKKKDYLGLTILYHNLALYSKKLKTTKYAVEKVKKIYNKFDGPVITAYYGSILTLLGRDDNNPIFKMSYVRKGLKYIDKAVKKDPNNLLVRMIRANNNFNLPSFFNRLEVAIKDFEWIQKNFEKGKIRLKLDRMAMIYYKLGDAYKRTGKLEKALKLWQKANKIAPESEYGKKAKENLEIFEE